VGSRWCNDECVLLKCGRFGFSNGVMMSVFITPSRTHNLPHTRRTLSSLPLRTHNLPHSRRIHSSLHHREPAIYHTLGEHTHHYTIENQQATTLEENTFIITPSRTHNLPHSRRTHSSLHHREPTIYYTQEEHTQHYTIDNPQSVHCGFSMV
jgi:hypothetical protein